MKAAIFKGKGTIEVGQRRVRLERRDLPRLPGRLRVQLLTVSEA